MVFKLVKIMAKSTNAVQKNRSGIGIGKVLKAKVNFADFVQRYTQLLIVLDSVLKLCQVKSTKTKALF